KCLLIAVLNEVDITEVDQAVGDHLFVSGISFIVKRLFVKDLFNIKNRFSYSHNQLFQVLFLYLSVFSEYFTFRY
ncbi:MAG: hypothetical protein KJ607_09640, partial [Bacteroidetes bacterium]|nr:hypothetical protein [Bacteroidota bacterium]